jgi:hypothetical protein
MHGRAFPHNAELWLAQLEEKMGAAPPVKNEDSLAWQKKNVKR